MASAILGICWPRCYDKVSIIIDAESMGPAGHSCAAARGCREVDKMFAVLSGGGITALRVVHHHKATGHLTLASATSFGPCFVSVFAYRPIRMKLCPHQTPPPPHPTPPRHQSAQCFHLVRFISSSSNSIPLPFIPLPQKKKKKKCQYANEPFKNVKHLIGRD